MLECNSLRCVCVRKIVTRRFSDQLFSVKILLILIQSMFEFMFLSLEIDIVKKNEGKKMLFLASVVSKQLRTPSVGSRLKGMTRKDLVKYSKH